MNKSTTKRKPQSLKLMLFKKVLSQLKKKGFDIEEDFNTNSLSIKKVGEESIPYKKGMGVCFRYAKNSPRMEAIRIMNFYRNGEVRKFGDLVLLMASLGLYDM